MRVSVQRQEGPNSSTYLSGGTFGMSNLELPESALVTYLLAIVNYFSVDPSFPVSLLSHKLHEFSLVYILQPSPPNFATGHTPF